MKQLLFLLVFIGLTAAAHAQRQSIGLRLSYFAGTYAYPSNSIYGRGVWTERFQGLEPALFYRLGLGRSPVYLHTEIGYYARPFEGTVLDPITHDPTIELKATHRLLVIPVLAGIRLRRARWHGFLASGFDFGAFLSKDWDVARYKGEDGHISLISSEYGFLVEGGLGYALSRRLYVELACRYRNAQYTTALYNQLGENPTNWVVKRVLPGITVGWRWR